MKIEVHVHTHNHQEPGASERLAEIWRLVREIGGKMTQQFNTVSALLADIKAATDQQAVRLGGVGEQMTAQGRRLQLLIDTLRTSPGMTAEELQQLANQAAGIKADVDASASSLDDEVDLLERTGVDEADPTPEPEPAPAGGAEITD